MKYQTALKVLFGGLVIFSSISEAKESAEIKFTISAQPSTCNLIVDNTYNLGDLPLGNKDDHPPLDIVINCPVNMKTAIMAKNLDGVLNNDGQRVAIPMPNAGTDKGPFFWLKYNSSRIYLRGLESDAFCSSTGLVRRCSLRPGTRVNENSPWGAGSVAIRFTVIYPA
ncbi:TPA: hypothetical protein RU934_004777 [Escherichia coli]|uniref:hypothetical protein n=1 Tax=Escherichia coli TaxID=562 RepID=UPI001300133C|nr:hypothetical protein [Escherichia coli]HCQ8908772.1 hypothetical protein [Escherichia coli]HEA0475444.1 hypothetical protein [Escherichia coli]